MEEKIKLKSEGNLKALFKASGVRAEDLKNKGKKKLQSLKKVGKRIFLTLFCDFKEV